MKQTYCGLVLEQLLNHFLQLLLLFRVQTVQLGDGICRCLPYVGRHVRHRLLDGEHHDRSNDGNSDAREDPKCTGSDELVGIFQSLLEGADGEEGHVLLLFCVPDQIDVYKLLDLLEGGREGWDCHLQFQH